MVSSEDRRVRARLLAGKYPESAQLLELYVQLTLLQDDISRNLPSEETQLAQFFPRLSALVPQIPFPPTGDAEQFFWRVVKQPLARAFQNSEQGTGPTCPSCGSKPVVGVLRGEGDGAKRGLLCSLCSLEWPYRRVICAHCGEEDKEKLPVYTASQIEHVRIEACDTCHCYLKSVDLTKDGFAIPEVDEIATVSLNLWADEHGYAKIETNLLGM
jgi:formate dehydrogenase maturation protein FdhE